MTKVLFFSFIILVCSNHSFAQKIYKIVDADGNVTFSEIEPTLEQDDPAEVESLKMGNSNNAMSTVRSENGREKCGDINLPYKRPNRYGSNKSSSSKYYFENVQNSKNNWQSSLSRISEQVVRSSKQYLESRKYKQSSTYAKNQSSQFQKRAEVNNARMRDLRCAINWADSKKASIHDNNESNQSEKIRLVAITHKLTETINRKCGEEPIYDPSSSANKEENRYWKTCSSTERRDLRDVERKISRLR
tara:strand:+ start:1198 stop:1938 length:741 start_codon:yes stop_codon:yes gene_type:complete